MDNHPYMEWGWYEPQEQFNDWIAGNAGMEPLLRVKLSIKDPKNAEPRLVNASNGLLHPSRIPIMIQLLGAAYEYHLKMEGVENHVRR